jgi:hypothetical protein
MGEFFIELGEYLTERNPRCSQETQDEPKLEDRQYQPWEAWIMKRFAKVD